MGKLKIHPVWAATLTGSLIGAAAAILYAPKSGEETRANLKIKASRASNILEQAFDNSGDTLGYLLGSIMAETASTAKEVIHALVNELKERKINK